MDAVTNPTTDTATITDTPRDWRAVLPIHPAAETFELVSKDELTELAADIERHGLCELVDVHQGKLLDGRNRLDALALLGRDIIDATGHLAEGLYRKVGENDPSFDPVAYVISKNIRRRHLTGEQKRDLIAKLLKHDPAQSNRQVAKATGVDHKTVAVVRTEREATGEIPQLEKTKGKDGKKRPARTRTRTTSPVKSSAPTPPASKPSTLAPSTSEAKPEAGPAKPYDFARLTRTWREVEAQRAAGNKTNLKAALNHHIAEANRALKADRWQ